MCEHQGSAGGAFVCGDRGLSTSCVQISHTLAAAGEGRAEGQGGEISSVSGHATVTSAFDMQGPPAPSILRLTAQLLTQADRFGVALLVEDNVTSFSLEKRLFSLCHSM